MKKILLLLVGIFSIVAVRAQMPHPDVLSDMILKTLETRSWLSNYECYTICFKYDGITYPAKELDAITVDELMYQLNKKNQHYRFRYSAPYHSELESIRNYLKLHGFKLPCTTLYLFIEFTDGHETHIYAEPRTINSWWKYADAIIGDGISCTWDYNFEYSRYEVVDTNIRRHEGDTTEYYFESTNLEKIDLKKMQQPARVDKFSDIVGYTNTTECQCNNILSFYSSPNIAEAEFITLNLDYLDKRHSRAIDESGVINYDCDTLYMLSSMWIPTYSSDYKLKCNKGLYDLTNKGLTPCDYSDLQSSEEMFEPLKAYPDAYNKQREEYDYHPFSYEWAMAPFTLWDNKRLIRNMWEVTDWSQNLIRIIIRDHEIVYFDAWSW